MQSAFAIPPADLLAHLGVPEQRSPSDLAALLGIKPISLAPSRLALGGPTVLALRYTVARLRGEAVEPVSAREWAWAGLLVERMDEGTDYSIPELGARMSLWGMATEDDWLVRLHGAGAAAVFAAGGWCAVRRWARSTVEGS